MAVTISLRVPTSVSNQAVEVEEQAAWVLSFMRAYKNRVNTDAVFHLIFSANQWQTLQCEQDDFRAISGEGQPGVIRALYNQIDQSAQPTAKTFWCCGSRSKPQPLNLRLVPLTAVNYVDQQGMPTQVPGTEGIVARGQVDRDVSRLNGLTQQDQNQVLLIWGDQSQAYRLIDVAVSGE